MKYLGFIIKASKALRIDLAKVKVIMEQAAPTTVKGTLGFLSFTNFYQRFIKGFSKITAPLTTLMKRDVKFKQIEEVNNAFKRLKKAFISAPMLLQFNLERETVVTTDSSGYCTGGVFYQYNDEGVLQPVAFFLKRNAPTECNYEIYDKELLTIIKCLHEQDAILQSIKQFKILTDHKSLEYFITTRKLTKRQVRWSEELSKYNFTIKYRPRKKNI